MIFHLSNADKNITGSEGAMSTARAKVEHFNSSSQYLAKLLDLRDKGTLQRCEDQKNNVKPLQDIVIRW